MIHRTQPPRQMIRRLIRRRHRDSEPNTRRRGRHGAHHTQRLVDGPLRARDHRCVETAIVDVVAAEHVGDEDAMDLGGLEETCKTHPVRDRVEFVRAVGGVAPEARRLVAAAWSGKGLVVASKWQGRGKECT
jgi:hypothetical protein